MINLDKFLKGEIAYIVTKHTIEDFLNTLEKCTDLTWESRCKPTEFIPESVQQGYVYLTVAGVYRGDPVLVYSNKLYGYFNHMKVEVF